VIDGLLTSSQSLVTGANLIIGLEFIALSLAIMNFFSKDSRCYSFDHRANGYARGEGVGVLVLKRLSDALRDGDTIRAIVRSTSSNQDGHTPGITLPSRHAQEALIRDTYAKAGLDLKTTRYVEAHGTGTPVSYASAKIDIANI
jgi:acyl transferase domain-containing protein